jgi:hypothetical protein
MGREFGVSSSGSRRGMFGGGGGERLWLRVWVFGGGRRQQQELSDGVVISLGRTLSHGGSECCSQKYRARLFHKVHYDSAMTPSLS